MSGSAVSSSLRKRPRNSSLRDRVDVREAGEVADDRGHRGAAAAPRRQQRARRVGPAHLDRHLARELEQVAVQQEEAGQAERVDHPQLLLQARARASPRQRSPRRIALVDPRRSTARPAARSAVGVLRARVAVAEVDRQVEAQPVGQRARLGDRVAGGPRSAPPSPPARRARARSCRAAAARTRRASVWWRRATNASCSGARARACAWTLPVATRGDPEPLAPARPAAGCARGRGAGTGAAARPAGRRARRRRAAAAASARRARRGARSRSGRRARRRAPRASPAARRAGRLAVDPSRVCACARVRIRHRLRQPSCVSTSSVRWRPSSRSISAPWIARRPSASAACANSIEPRRRCGRSAPTRRSRARPRRPPARRAARRRRGTRRRSGRGARRTWTNTCSHAGRTDHDRPMCHVARAMRIPVREPYDWDRVLAWLDPRSIPDLESVGGRRLLAAGTVTVARADARPRGHRIRPTRSPSRACSDTARADPARSSATRLFARAPGIRVPGTWSGWSSPCAPCSASRSASPARVPDRAQADRASTATASRRPRRARCRVVALPGMRRRRAAPRRALRVPAGEGRRRRPRARPPLDRARTRAQLLALPGFGHWTVEYIAMRALSLTRTPGRAATSACAAARPRPTPSAGGQWRALRRDGAVADLATPRRHATAVEVHQVVRSPSGEVALRQHECTHVYTLRR